jgi:toxin ParE1/3/4
MRFRFLEGARKEFKQAVSYYERQQKGLGDELEFEVFAALDRASLDPTSFEAFDLGVYRIPVQRFDYSVFFTVEEDVLLVAAVMHNRRRPSYWKRRLRRR